MRKLFLLSLISTSLLLAEGGIVEKQAKEFGFTKCLSSVVKLEEFFTKNKTYGSYTSAATKDPNNEIFSATLELTYDNSTPEIIDFVVSPNNKENTCSYNYTRTWYDSRNCMNVSRSDFLKDFEFKGALNKDISAFTNKASVKVFLSNAGSGCLIQKKETGYRFNNQDK